MTDSAIQHFQSLAYKPRKPAQPKMPFLQLSAPAPGLARPLPAQLKPYIQQEKTQTDKQKSIGRILSRRPAPHFSRAAVAAFYAKAQPIFLAHSLRRHLNSDENVGQPLRLLLLATASFGGRIGPTHRDTNLDFAGFATAKTMLAQIAFSAYAQGFQAASLAANRTSDNRRLTAASQKADHFEAGKPAIQIKQRSLYLQAFQAIEEKFQDALVTLFARDELDGQRQAQAVSDEISCRHAIDARGARFGGGSDPQAVGLLGFAVVGLVMVINRYFLRAEAKRKGQGGGQGLIDGPLQLGQLFDAQLLVDIASDRVSARCRLKVRAERFECVTRGGDAKQDVKKLIGGANIAVGFELQIRHQMLFSLLEHVVIAQFWRMMFQELASPLQIGVGKFNHIEDGKLLLSNRQISIY